MSPTEKLMISDVSKAFSEEEKTIVVANMPLEKLKTEIARRELTVNQMIYEIHEAFHIVYEVEDLTLEEKIEIINEIKKALRMH